MRKLKSVWSSRSWRRSVRDVMGVERSVITVTTALVVAVNMS
jgi:hypothetical protein